MELKPKSSKLPVTTHLFPLNLNEDNIPSKIHAEFNGFSVTVTDPEHMKNVISMGCYGKATLSRSFPKFEKRTWILRQRQFQKRMEWGGEDARKVVVIPDSDEESEEIKPEYRLDKSGLKESVWMSLEEAFFLSYAVECLEISHGSRILANEEMWELFSKTDPFYAYNYIAYYYFRMKNWVVKPGVKYGGDYLLYRHGPTFYHASYVVIIDIVNSKMQRIPELKRRSMDDLSLLGLYRVCETTSKELMILQVILPEDVHQVQFQNLQVYNIREISMRRWILTQENPP